MKKLNLLNNEKQWCGNITLLHTVSVLIQSCELRKTSIYTFKIKSYLSYPALPFLSQAIFQTVLLFRDDLQ